MNAFVCETLVHSHVYQVNVLQIKAGTFEPSEYNLIIFLTEPKLALADKTAVLNGLGEVAVCGTT